ncbi:MAG: CoA transferase [Steroidobacteraceae bacterium]
MKSEPLSGLRVVDCSSGTAGPRASGLLADYGADVIWVEPPGGDLERRRAPAAAAVFNRSKRSMVLDLNVAADKEKLLQLADRADVFIETWQPGSADSMGLGYRHLHARNPQLVYCSISGFGVEGKYSRLPAREPLVHALMATMFEQAGHREGPIFQGLPFASIGAAQLATIGILAALYRRLDDGCGRHVETSLMDGLLAYQQMMWGESDEVLAAGANAPDVSVAATRLASTTRMVTRSFICGDDEYIGIHTAATGAFGRLMQVLGLDDKIPPTTSGIDLGTPLTKEQADLLESRIHDIFASQPRAYWVQRLMEADVCAIEHLRPTAVFDEPQPQHSRMVVRVDDPVLGQVDQVAPGVHFDQAQGRVRGPAPTPGQHTADVLKWLDEPDAGSSWRPPRRSDSPDTRPLMAGVKVLDFGAYYAGPYSSRVLADFGADVIKVETMIGDQLRGLERPFFAAQAGKRSLAANLKDAGLRRAVHELLKWADVVHHNMRPGAAERLNLGVEHVRAVNPEAIYLYAPGWGSTGPHRLRQSFAPMLSGYVGASYEVAGQFNEPMPSTGNEDPGNGLLGTVGMLLALLHRRRTGVALYCENPQLHAAMGMMAHAVRKADGEVVGAGLLDVLQMGTDALESLYATADGWICVAVREDSEIKQFQAVLGIDILGDERFATIEARVTEREALTDLLRDAFANRTTAEWLALFAPTGLGVVEPVDASLKHTFFIDPEQRRLDRVAEVRHPQKGNVREMVRLVRISDAQLPAHRLAPGLGEHNDSILAWLGYSQEEIQSLRARGNVR